MSDYNLVLASGSPRRQELLSHLGLPFQVIPSQIEEIVDPKLSPAELVCHLAEQKALAVAHRLSNTPNGKSTIVLGGDTVVAINKQILGQPKSHADAKRMLMLLEGRCHEVYTGVCLIDLSGKTKLVDFAVSRVYFRHLSESEIDCYIKTGETMDKAGSYALQGLGSCFVERIDGCYTNVIGYPMPIVVHMLRKVGIKVLGT